MDILTQPMAETSPLRAAVRALELSAIADAKVAIDREAATKIVGKVITAYLTALAVRDRGER